MIKMRLKWKICDESLHSLSDAVLGSKDPRRCDQPRSALNCCRRAADENQRKVRELPGVSARPENDSPTARNVDWRNVERRRIQQFQPVILIFGFLTNESHKSFSITTSTHIDRSSIHPEDAVQQNYPNYLHARLGSSKVFTIKIFALRFFNLNAGLERPRHCLLLIRDKTVCQRIKNAQNLLNK